jgi:hypothetical protein
MKQKTNRREPEPTRPKRKPRAGWAAAFKIKRARRDEELFLPSDMQNDFDHKEWTWPTHGD